MNKLIKRVLSIIETTFRSGFKQQKNLEYYKHENAQPILIGLPPTRYPENSEGDFYVQNEVCINCRAPQAEAPDLIDHSKNEWGHCFFKKQPQTADELDRAINAIQVSCIAGVRYGGKDVAILKRLADEGFEDECDYKLS